MRISDWSSDVCSSDLRRRPLHRAVAEGHDARLDRRDIAVGLLQQALAARGQVEGEPGLAELDRIHVDDVRSEEHTSELQSLMRISYAVFCLKNKTISQLRQQCLLVKYSHTNTVNTTLT